MNYHSSLTIFAEVGFQLRVKIWFKRELCLSMVTIINEIHVFHCCDST